MYAPAHIAFVDKAGAPVAEEARIRLRGGVRRFVSRGGEKLAGALEDLAFGWTYTTTDAAQPMLNVREGVRGLGPLAKLGETAPAHFAEVLPRDGSVDTLLASSMLNLCELVGLRPEPP